MLRILNASFHFALILVVWGKFTLLRHHVSTCLLPFIAGLGIRIVRNDHLGSPHFTNIILISPM